MKKIFVILWLLNVYDLHAQNLVSSLPTWKASEKVAADWMLHSPGRNAEVYRSADAKDIILDNGLLKRSFRTTPNLACIDFTNLSTNEQLLRAISPEARITLNGKDYNIGGLYGQTQRAYLKQSWLHKLTAGPSDFQYLSFKVAAIEPYVKWKPSQGLWAASQRQPKGKMVTFVFTANQAAVKGIKVSINYEIYDGIPLICKWVSIENTGQAAVKVNKVVNEILATPEEESAVVGLTDQMKVPHGLYVESNYAFNDSMTARLSDQTSHWKADSTYTSQVSYLLNTPCLLEVYPPVGPGELLQPHEKLNSIRTNELMLDSYDRERNGLAQRLMYARIAPWATQNPIFMHLVSVDPKIVKNAIDQCATVGFEGIILSFFSGLNMEDISDKNLSYFKELADYAHRKGVLLGGYSLFSSRRINDEEDVIDPKSGKADVHALYGKSPCLGSKWGLDYLEHLKVFIKKTGFDLFEHDGPYAGDVCASTKHPGHKGLDDSQWQQMELQKNFYHWCAANAVYVNSPDWYFLDGACKTGLGYREQNFSLPRDQQVLLNRQNIYDGTWEKMSSMSWGFVPLTEYHGGGAEATLEPLAEHRDTYQLLMTQYFGAGIQACYRGPRLYDTEDTKLMVAKTVAWYKKYRTILNSPVIHLRRPDGRDWDGILHVNPEGDHRALAMLYNPTAQAIKRRIKLPLYYSGLTKNAMVGIMEGTGLSYAINSDHMITLEVTIPANGFTYLVIRSN